jgi:hypothetical protein
MTFSLGEGFIDPRNEHCSSYASMHAGRDMIQLYATLRSLQPIAFDYKELNLQYRAILKLIMNVRIVWYDK